MWGGTLVLIHCYCWISEAVRRAVAILSVDCRTTRRKSAQNQPMCHFSRGGCMPKTKAPPRQTRPPGFERGQWPCFVSQVEGLWFEVQDQEGWHLRRFVEQGIPPVACEGQLVWRFSFLRGEPCRRRRSIGRAQACALTAFHCRINTRYFVPCCPRGLL